MNRFSFSIVGASSLVVIFAILCIIIFALLSVSTANAEEALSINSAEHVKAYYAADAEAEMILAEIRAGNMPDSVKRTGNLYEYACRIDENQELQVEVLVEEEKYTVERWQTVYTGEWQNDDSLNVWDGQ